MAAVTDWDENTLRLKVTGGSETAAIEVANGSSIKLIAS